jgi:hypothetical protein
VAGGAAISASALVCVYVLLPLVHHWSGREAVYRASRERWARLAALNANTDRLRSALTAERTALTGTDDEILTGTSPALAASNLQELVQRYAQESDVQLDRVDAAGESRPLAPELLAIPIQLQARGDVYGLVAFLERLQHGDKLISIGELTVNGGFDGVLDQSSRGTQTLLWTMSLNGFYARPAGSKGS